MAPFCLSPAPQAQWNVASPAHGSLSANTQGPSPQRTLGCMATIPSIYTLVKQMTIFVSYGHAMKDFETIETIQAQIKACENLPFRDKRKIAKQVAYWAFNWEKSETKPDLSKIPILVRALELGEQFHDSPGKWANARFRLLSRKRILLNLPEPTTITETARKLAVEMGSIVFHDAETALPTTFFDTDHPDHLRARERGEFCEFALGGDGLVNIRLRAIDCSEPILATSELRRSISATPAVWVSCPSRRIAIFGGGNNTLEFHTGFQHALLACYVTKKRRRREILALVCDAVHKRPKPQKASLEDYFSS